MNYQRKRVAKRLASGLLAGALALGGLAISGGTASATATVTEDLRIAGADRYATANAVAVAMVGARVNVTSVVIASGENFADGLAASALAGTLGAANGGSPMLLTSRDSLPTSVLATLTAIRSTNAGLLTAVIVGGTSAVSAAVEAQLVATGLTVVRISGADRYATADAVAAAVKANSAATTIGTFGGYRTAFLANGANFPDALAASAWAFKNRHPIFLTDGTTLSAGTKAAITAAGVQQIVILGGTSAVSAEVATAAASATGVITTVRVSGTDRYGTATALATTLSAVDAQFKTRAILVNGTNFPDALAAAQLAGQAAGYAIIPVTSPLPAAVSTWLTANQATLSNIRAIGGTSSVPADLVTTVKAGATISKLAATVTGLDGASTARVTFSGLVTTASAQAVANYSVVSALGVVKTITGSVYTAPTATALGYATLTVAGGLVAGDVISVIAANTVVNAAGVGVAPTSFTVVADASAPTAQITAIAGSASDTQQIWVTFSANTNFTGLAAALPGNLVVTKGSGAIGATPAAATNCVQVAGTTTVACDLTAAAALVAGDTVTLKAAAAVSTASTPVANAAVSTTVVADAVAPLISSVRYTASGTGGDAASITFTGATGVLVLTARDAGLAGNAFSLTRVVGALSCAYTAATKVITITAAVTDTAEAIAGACSAAADVSAVASVAATTAGAVGAAWTANTTAFSGGKDLVTYTVTFSEPLSAGAFGNLAVDLNGDGDITDTDEGAMTAMVAGGVAGQMQLAGKFQVVRKTATLPLSGVSTVRGTVAFTDLNGTALSVATTTHIVQAFAG